MCDVAAQTTNASLNTYTSPNQSFQLSYPANWKLTKNGADDNVQIVYKSDSRNEKAVAVISIRTYPITENLDAIPNYIELYKIKTIDNFKSKPEAQVNKVEIKNVGIYKGVLSDWIEPDPDKKRENFIMYTGTL